MDNYNERMRMKIKNKSLKSDFLAKIFNGLDNTHNQAMVKNMLLRRFRVECL